MATYLGLKGKIRRTLKKSGNIIQTQLKNFFERDDVSKMTAGKNETKTQNKQKSREGIFSELFVSYIRNTARKEESCHSLLLKDTDPFMYCHLMLRNVKPVHARNMKICK